SDVGLAALANLTRLEQLWLQSGHWGGEGKVTDEGLQHLASLQKLVVLNLTAHPVTASSPVHLLGLMNLEYLNLGGTRTTVLGATGLWAFVPKVAIHVAGTVVKDLSTARPATRRDVDGSASFEVPDSWEVLRWVTSDQCAGTPEEFLCP